MYIVEAVRVDAFRLRNSLGYVVPDNYTLFVLDGTVKQVCRKVMIGESCYYYVDVVSSLKEAVREVISIMEEYKNKKSICIN